MGYLQRAQLSIFDETIDDYVFPYAVQLVENGFVYNKRNGAKSYFVRQYFINANGTEASTEEPIEPNLGQFFDAISVDHQVLIWQQRPIREKNKLEKHLQYHPIDSIKTILGQ